MIYDLSLLEKLSEAYRPFPGRYPTRIRIETTGKVPLFYLGKPVPALKNLVRNTFFRKGGRSADLRISEFDQNGLLRTVRSPGAMQEAPFFNTVFPWPFFYRTEMSRSHQFFLMLDRTLCLYKGRKLYRNSFCTGEDYQPYFDLILSKAVRGVVTKTLIPTWVRDEIIQKIIKETDAWMGRIKEDADIIERKVLTAAFFQTRPPVPTYQGQNPRWAIDRAWPPPEPQYIYADTEGTRLEQAYIPTVAT